MERASTAALPAYTPSDARDLHVALTEIDRQLNVRYSRRMGARMLMGYSIGAFRVAFHCSKYGCKRRLDPIRSVRRDRYAGAIALCGWEAGWIL